jgi:branched-chain amino acid transport system substrate-binding protein
VKRAAVIAALAFLALGLGASAHAKSLRVGLITPLSGDVKTFGESVRNGFEIAVSEINAAGGIAGKRIVIFVMDDRNDPTEAANAAHLLINRHRVEAIVGPVTSKTAIPVSDLAQSYKVPAITPSATNEMVTVADGKRKEYMFRACFIDSFQGSVMARFARETLKAQKAAVLSDSSNDYSRGVAEVFRNAFAEGGGTIVAFESYGKDDVDFSALLTKVRAVAPDVLFLPDYYNKVGLIARQARERGVKAAFIGADGWDSPDLVKVAGQAVEGGHFSNHYSPEDTRPEVVAWVKKYKAKHRQVPDVMAALTYDATYLLAEAVRRAGSNDPKKIRDALASIRDFEGVTGQFAINENGDAIKSAVIIRIQDGKPSFLKVVDP